jgi:hypothetical protein
MVDVPIELYKYFETSQLVQDIFESCSIRAENQPKRDYLGMSSIGFPCERALWFDYNNKLTVPIDGRLARIFEMGNMVETRILADLELAGYKVEYQQLTFKDFDGRFAGHCDGIISNITNKQHILEIKSANDKSFNKFKAHGIKLNPKYYAQIQCYMGYSKLYRGIFIVENKNDQDLYVERIKFEPDVFEELRAKAWRIINYKEVPEATIWTGYCNYCTFNPICDKS